MASALIAGVAGSLTRMATAVSARYAIIGGTTTKMTSAVLNAPSSSASMQVRTATKKAGGSSRNGRKTAGKRLGVKKHNGSSVIAGNIIVRQRGAEVHPGQNVGIGRDFTLYALTDGVIKFTKAVISYSGKKRKFVHVMG